MRTLFSTEDVPIGREFKAWREAICGGLVPVEQRQIDDTRFTGRIETAGLGDLTLTRVVQEALITEVTPNTIRKDPKQDGFSVLIKVRGGATLAHLGRDVQLGMGDLVVIDRAKPAVLTSTAGSSSLLFDVPRIRLEDNLGASINYSGLLLDHDQPGIRLMRSFLAQFTAVADAMPADTASRMSDIAVDLLSEAIAERLGREEPKSVSGTLMVQRAKTYARSHLGRTDLDAQQLAMEVGISVRRLQELFQERGQGVSEWIWQQRCFVAAKLLRDRGHAHMSIAQVAHRCGFSSLPHFSRRFKKSQGASPRDFRIQAQG